MGGKFCKNWSLSSPTVRNLRVSYFSKNSNIDDLDISPVFLSRTNLKLHNIAVTPKLVKRVITNPGSSKASGLDCITVVVLKNSYPELLYILAVQYLPKGNLCSIFLEAFICGPCIQECWRKVRERWRNYLTLSLLFMVNNVFEKPVNNRLV